MQAIKRACGLMVFAVALMCGAGESAAFSAESAVDDPQQAVKFEQYPVTNIFKGKSARPRLNNSEAWHFRTTIREGASTGSNFAGQYTIVQLGCGTAG
jgi:hypothetical protein